MELKRYSSCRVEDLEGHLNTSKVDYVGSL